MSGNDGDQLVVIASPPRDTSFSRTIGVLLNASSANWNVPPPGESNVTTLSPPQKSMFRTFSPHQQAKNTPSPRHHHHAGARSSLAPRPSAQASAQTTRKAIQLSSSTTNRRHLTMRMVNKLGDDMVNSTLVDSIDHTARQVAASILPPAAPSSLARPAQPMASVRASSPPAHFDRGPRSPTSFVSPFAGTATDRVSPPPRPQYLSIPVLSPRTLSPRSHATTGTTGGVDARRSPLPSASEEASAPVAFALSPRAETLSSFGANLQQTQSSHHLQQQKQPSHVHHFGSSATSTFSSSSPVRTGFMPAPTPGSTAGFSSTSPPPQPLLQRPHPIHPTDSNAREVLESVRKLRSDMVATRVAREREQARAVEQRHREAIMQATSGHDGAQPLQIPSPVAKALAQPWARATPSPFSSAGTGGGGGLPSSGSGVSSPLSTAKQAGFSAASGTPQSVTFSKPPHLQPTLQHSQTPQFVNTPTNTYVRHLVENLRTSGGTSPVSTSTTTDGGAAAAAAFGSPTALDISQQQQQSQQQQARPVSLSTAGSGFRGSVLALYEQLKRKVDLPPP
eukprot:TRINITY_DN118_c0_g1_i1.p1 TRINITY_DN118_c0_g1~~TRINITY_DN118_c0_g1_i1.p1  ORF type:complete len:565 (-),score=146.41 TRINITY_DN118_c0_g1_i1:2584-4278(-)